MSQNSADSTNGNNSKNIPVVVNNHADRLMDELFADIEELLSGDLNEQRKAQSAAINPVPSSAAKAAQEPPISYEPAPEYAQPPVIPSPPPVVSEPPRPRSIWPKVLGGLGLIALLAGGGVWWLAKQGKLSFGSLAVSGLSNSVSNADVKFADYLSKALNKIDSTSTPSPAANSIAIPNPPGVIEPAAPTVPGAAALPTVGNTVAPNQSASSSFARIIAGNPPVVEFIIDGVAQQVKVGEPIGKSGWVLTPAINPVDNEVVIKRNGELRSLKAGQQL